MRRIISFMHISLDGFVAGPQGQMDWITINPEIFQHVEQRISKGDTSLYGRKTFEMMEAYWPTAPDKPNATAHDINHGNWYKKTHKLVLSKTIHAANHKNTTVITDDIENQLEKIKQTGNNEILLFGSPTATHSLIDLGLIDGYWLFVNPIILGNGIPLFRNIKEKIALNLESSTVFKCGVTELSYTVKR